MLYRIETAHLPELFARFSEVIGEQYWRKRVHHFIKNRLRQNRLLKSYLEDEEALALGFALCSDLVKRYKRLPAGHREGLPLSTYQSLTFAAQALYLLDKAPYASRNAIVGRIRGGFQCPTDLRAMQLEFQAGAHFAQQGYTVRWPELENSGTSSAKKADLLIEDLGPMGLEVECKSIAKDRGRRIGEGEAIEFWNVVQKCIPKEFSRGLSTGIFVVITVPLRLPTSLSERQALAAGIYRSILAGADLSTPEFSVRIGAFDPNLALTPDQIPGNGMILSQQAVEGITGAANANAFFSWTEESSGALLLVLRSAKDDTIFDATLRELRQGAEQMSGERPGILLAGLDGVSVERMVDLGMREEDPYKSPNRLRVEASRFLANDTSRDHIVGLSFLSRSELLRNPEDDNLTQRSVAYHFARPQSPMWHEDFGSIMNT